MFIKFSSTDQARDKVVSLIKDRSIQEEFRSILDRLCAIIYALNSQKKIKIDVYREMCLSVNRDIITTFKNEKGETWVKISPRDNIYIIFAKIGSVLPPPSDL